MADANTYLNEYLLTGDPSSGYTISGAPVNTSGSVTTTNTDNDPEPISSGDAFTVSGDATGSGLNGKYTYQGDAYTGTVNNEKAYGFVASKGGSLYLFTNTTRTDGSAVKVDPNGTTTFAATCYAAGTMIKTARGDVAVEALAVGDLVVTSGGAHRPIRWLGHRTYDCRRNPGPRRAWPVRIAAHAFGSNIPSSDLYLSAGHSVCVTMVAEVLIPVQELVNGSSVAYAPMDTVTYWHVELDSHDILLANDMPAESFLEMGDNRALLSDAAPGDLPIEVVSRTHADFCRRFVDGGPLLAIAREELTRRAEELGWAPSRAIDIVGLMGGRRIKPLVLGSEAIFNLPASGDDMLIHSRLISPALMGQIDQRELGLAVYGLAVVTDDGETHQLELDAAELRDCFHEGERQEGLHYRWTNGDLVVPHALLEAFGTPSMLRLSFEPSTIRGWTAPKGLAGGMQQQKLRLVG